MAHSLKEIVTTLPEYEACELGAPFKVVLKDSVRQVSHEDGEIVSTIIPNPRGLLKRVAVTRLLLSRKLSGPDLKFIRKALGLKAKTLAGIVGIEPEHLSRVESGDRVLSPGAEKCLRLAILLDQTEIADLPEPELCDDLKVRAIVTEYKKAISEFKAVMNAMIIPSAYDASEELVLSFHIERNSKKKGSVDPKAETDDAWEQVAALALAA